MPGFRSGGGVDRDSGQNQLARTGVYLLLLIMVRELVCGSCGRRYNSNYRGQHPKCKTCEFQHDHDHGLYVAPEFEEALVMLEKMDAAKKKEANLNKVSRVDDSQGLNWHARSRRGSNQPFCIS